MPADNTPANNMPANNMPADNMPAKDMPVKPEPVQDVPLSGVPVTIWSGKLVGLSSNVDPVTLVDIVEKQRAMERYHIIPRSAITRDNSQSARFIFLLCIVALWLALFAFLLKWHPKLLQDLVMRPAASGLSAHMADLLR